MKTLAARITEDGIKSVTEYGNTQTERHYDTLDDWQKQANPWTITLRRGRKRMTVPFFTGPAITEEPDAKDALNALLLDASGYENASSFEDWCSEYGYDTDSRTAERIWKQVERQTKKLKQFLGDKYETYLWETGDL
jgi:hypothetical protein